MTTITAPAPIRPSATSTRTMIDIDVGPYRLGVDSALMLGVHDQGQMTTLSVSNALDDRFAVGTIIRTQKDLVRAVYMDRLLGVESSEPRQPMVLVRGRREGDDFQTLGLIVDATSRPKPVAPQDWHPMPEWVRAGMQVPCNAMVVSRSDSGQQSELEQGNLRLLLDTPEFDTHHVDPDHGPSNCPTEQASETAVSTTAVGQLDPLTADETRVHGTDRGLLVFAPTESERLSMRVAIAVPMSFVLGVENSHRLIQIPTRDPHLAGVTVWNDMPVPVIHIGDTLGLERSSHSSEQNASGSTPESVRLLVFRTPSNQILGCLAHAQMRSLRTPRTTSVIDDCGMNHEYLLGAFLTSEGPLAVPDLDRLVMPDRWQS